MSSISQLVEKILDLTILNKSPQEKQFIASLHHSSKVPLQYEDQELLDYGMDFIPFERLYQKAEKDFAKDDSFGEQDYVAKELVKWFKHDFFTWVNQPSCDFCGGDTQAIGTAHPTPEEKKYGAKHVEVYQCKQCSAINRFPRYNSIRKLLETRRGRCGEFANTFTFLCRAVGCRARWVWNQEDHVWTEIYSEKRKRWIHIDPSEGAFNEPLIYQNGWGKKMSYCIGFSIDTCQDVTKRYVTKPDMGLKRDKVSEPLLAKTLEDITIEKRKGLTDEEKKILKEQDELERRELDGYRPSQTTNGEVGPRESGAGDWTAQRGENGS